MFQKPTDTSSATKLPIKQDAWMLFRFENLEVIRLDLDPGDAMDNHINDWRIVFYILQGEGILDISGSRHQLSAGQAIAVEAGLERYWRNSGSEKLQLLVIKTEDPG